METKTKKIVCDAAYKNAILDYKGNIYLCCPQWNGFYSIGNIHETTFSEMWNGERARAYRRQFIDNDYKYCNTDLCSISPISPWFKYPPESDIAPKPEVFIFNYDSICNIRCKFCNECSGKNITPRLEYFEDNMERLLDDMLENTKIVNPSIAGEALFSPSSRKLIKTITKNFPNIKFSITSNGLAATKEAFEKLNLVDRICYLNISLHAATKKTYDKMIVGSNFDRIIENIKYASTLKGTILQLNCVVNAWNYHEMPAFIELAKSVGAKVLFLQVMENDYNTYTFPKINVFDKNHPKYNDFCKVLKTIDFNTKDCSIPIGWKNLECTEKSLFRTIKDSFWHYK